MREILFLVHRIPWPADRGDKIRSHHILKHLAQMAPVHVGAFADDARDMGFVGEMAGAFAEPLEITIIWNPAEAGQPHQGHAEKGV